MAIELLKLNKINDEVNGIKYSVYDLEFDTENMKLYGMMEIEETTNSFYIEFKDFKTDYGYLENVSKKFSTALFMFLSKHVSDTTKTTIDKGKITVVKTINIHKSRL